MQRKLLTVGTIYMAVKAAQALASGAVWRPGCLLPFAEPRDFVQDASMVLILIAGIRIASAKALSPWRVLALLARMIWARASAILSAFGSENTTVLGMSALGIYVAESTRWEIIPLAGFFRSASRWRDPLSLCVIVTATLIVSAIWRGGGGAYQPTANPTPAPSTVRNPYKP